MYNNSIQFKKIILIILFNIIVISILWFISDFCLYVTSLKIHNKLSIKNLKNFYSKPYNPINSIDYFFDLKNNTDDENQFKTRLPVGLMYKSSPILVFGCSFAYGTYLNYNQIFSYKLANQINKPVFNRAIPGRGIQQMYYQTTTDEFYKSVPPCNTIIYILISDHFRRMSGESFLISDRVIYLHYKYKNKSFIIDNFNNPFVIFYKYNYTLESIRKIYNYFYLKNNKNADKITDEALAYFIQTRENLQNHWHNKINFVVYFYKSYIFEDILIHKLRNNNFIVITKNDLTNENMLSKKYQLSDNIHPNEAAWDLLTPLFVDKMKEMNIF
ncbi:hypothetical protein IJG14_06000 [bacterium]|nr:hypothetical protein [bacterium]